MNFLGCEPPFPEANQVPCKIWMKPSMDDLFKELKAPFSSAL